MPRGINCRNNRSERMLEKYFNLEANGTDVKTEILAGITTFLTMAYIIVVQPMVLSGKMFGFETGMDFGSVMTATCVSAFIATAVMALYAKYPIAQAPGMGQNFFFVFSVLPAIAAAGVSDPWQTALGIIFISGMLFLLLSLTGIREKLMDAISPNMKNGMAVGIGIFIAFIGLQNAGLIISAASIVPTESGPVISPGTMVKLNPAFASADILVFFIGLVVTAVLYVKNKRGSILYGIAASTVVAVLLKVLTIWIPAWESRPFFAASALVNRFSPADGLFSLPPSVAPTFFKMDIMNALSGTMIPFIVIFLFMDVFDTIGTLIGVSQRAGFMVDNKLPRARQAMLSDAIGTVTGTVLGTSTVTSFIESAAGVEQGGRTGLTALTTAVLFLAALFISPIVFMIGSYPAITAPALVIVGALMMRNVVNIEWEDYSESLPAFLTILTIPLSFSIGDGLAVGFISYPVIKYLSGKGKEISWLMYVLSLILIIYFVVFRAQIG